MLAWEHTLAPETGTGLPLFLRIARAVVADIRRGRLGPGDPLPGSRRLARHLGVNRNTVLSSYRELLAEGWVTTTPAGGTFVCRELPGNGHPPRVVGANRAAARVGFSIAPPIGLDHPPHYPPGTLVLAKGTPDVRLLPMAELARAFRRTLIAEGPALLTYGDPRGHPRLRAALAAMLSAARGISVPADAILVTHGSQMALDLAARALVDPGDVVVIEALGHPFVRSTLALAGARLVPVPVDDAGLVVDALPAIAQRHRIRAIIVTPHHQFPTTSVMPAARRLQLLAFARERGIAVVEDDYDHEFHYDGHPVLPLASTDPAGVIYVGTLSKILAPGLRVGFAVAPTPVVARMASLRIATDIQGDLLIEAALADLFERGELGRHVRRMRRIYRARRDALVAALERHLGSALTFKVPSGGMALWAHAAPGIDVDRWAEQALACGVAFRGGRMYDAEGAYQPCMRLGFTFHTEAELEEAARRMATALAALRRRSAATAS
jgi:GntR family transcriptional regulator/MocR family aminotransferase